MTYKLLDAAQPAGDASTAPNSSPSYELAPPSSTADYKNEGATTNTETGPVAA